MAWVFDANEGAEVKGLFCYWFGNSVHFVKKRENETRNSGRHQGKRERVNCCEESQEQTRLADASRQTEILIIRETPTGDEARERHS